MRQPPTSAVKPTSRRGFVRHLGKIAAEAVSPLPRRSSTLPATRAMRTADGRRGQTGAKAIPAPPELAVLAHNHMGFGPRPGDLEAFQALGGDDDARLTAYVDQQLDPASIDDAESDARIAASGFTTLGKSLEQLWADHVVADVDYYERSRPFYETEAVTFIRAVYSRRQLLEVLADFWHNHFNVYGRDYYIGPVLVHYDRDVIRANLLGNFRTMIEAMTKSTAMLFFLDNYSNSNAGPNENFARELLELHTMGADAYLGVMPQSQVPVDGEGLPIGYVDADIYEVTRCFTGWSVSASSWDPEVGNTGLFHYRADWHDRFQKNVLGTYLPPDQPELQDGLDVLDLVAAHPATARFISKKLCRRLIGDEPPQEVIDQAAAVFADQQDQPDQLKRVVRTILLSDAFRSGWGDKVKRPFEIAVSAMRAANADFPFTLDDSDTGTFFWHYDNAGQALFAWPGPDGYPDDKRAWQSATPRVMSWRVCNWLIDVEDDNEVHRLDVVGQTPAGVRSANALVDFWAERVLGRTPGPADRQRLVEFMAQGHNPTLDLPLDSDSYTRERLRALVGLIFMSPEFLWR